MPRIEADFSTIAAGNEPLPDNDYRCTIVDIEEKTTKESQLPALNITLEVGDEQHPEFTGRYLFDFIVLQTKEGKPNRMGLSQLKAYAVATLGEEEASSPEGIDTDGMKGGTVVASVKLRSWEKKDALGNVTDSGMSNEIRKISAA
jgi:hypothetical protein